MVPRATESMRTAALLACPSASVLMPTDRHMAVLEELAVRLPRLREHGVSEIRTADADFHQFAFLDVINPLADVHA